MSILKLPISMTNLIILLDSVKYCPDRRLYIKIFREYATLLPIYKVKELCNLALQNLPEDSDFQLVLEALWKSAYISQQEFYR